MNIKQFLVGPSIWILIGSIIVAIGIYRTSVQTRRFEEELKAKNDEVTRLNKYILSSITGGDSFCYLALVSINHVSNNCLLAAVSQGKYPLYDISFRIVDLEEFSKLNSENLVFEDIIKTDTVINIGNISPSTSVILRKLNLGSGNEKNYNVFVSARNGFFTQLIRLRRIEGEWRMATKVIRREDEKEIKLYENIDQKFPRNNEGEIDWK